MPTAEALREPTFYLDAVEKRFKDYELKMKSPHPIVKGASSQSKHNKKQNKKRQQKQKISGVPTNLGAIEWSGGPKDTTVYECQFSNDTTKDLKTELMGKNTDMTKMIQAEAEKLGLKSSRLKRAPPSYYSETLEWRRDVLGAPSCKHLCKTLLVRNSKCTNSDCSDPFNSKYYFVVKQYAAGKFNNEKTIDFIRAINDGKVKKKKINFRSVDPKQCAEMTGFPHNGVTVIGSQMKIPIILDQRICDELGYIWLGGGEEDVKWAIDVHEFRNVFKPFVTHTTYEGWNDGVNLERMF